MMKEPAMGTVVILCSGFGLGFYLPGLLIQGSLRRSGIETEVEVFESLLTPEKVGMVERNRAAYHRNFRLAIASTKIPGNSSESIEAQRLDSLLSRWRDRDCRHFISLSGHWVSPLDAYRKMRPGTPIHADLLYLDAGLAPSWTQLRKRQQDYAIPYTEVCLYANRQQLRYSVGIDGEQPLSYAERNRRLVVHGGGWGIGTYEKSVPHLERAGYGLDVVCYESVEMGSLTGQRRYFRDDPGWRAWHRNSVGEHSFPPFGEVVPDEPSPSFVTPSDCHGLYKVIREAQGIVSKPGAGTLIDSLASATPLIMLDPFGPHEESNAQVWQSLGLGLPYESWAASGFSHSPLETLHQNLVKQQLLAPDYAQAYIERHRVRRTGTAA
jgi:hypothetical protein